MSELPSYLFVYGTLQQGYKNGNSSTFISPYTTFHSKGKTTGKLFLNDFYPCLVEGTENEVFGEIYVIKNEEPLFDLLDSYEDYFAKDIDNSLYIRKLTTIFSEKENELIDCWCYFYNQPTVGLIRILSGNFLEFMEARN